MLITIKYIHDNYKLSRRTLINWEEEGLLKPYRTPKGRRRYKKEDTEYKEHGLSQPQWPLWLNFYPT